jgi:hypothetical protein
MYPIHCVHLPYLRVMEDYIGIGCLCLSGILAIATPLHYPFAFLPRDREEYVRAFHHKRIYIGPSISLFAILISSWVLVLSIFQVEYHTAILIVGSVYVYIVILYSLVDEYSTPSMAGYFILNLILTMSLYNTKYTLSELYMYGVILEIFVYLALNIHTGIVSWNQTFQWYIWYAGTLGGLLR